MSSGYKKGAKTRPLGTSNLNRLTGKNTDPKWAVSKDYKPPRKVTDEELQSAKKIFFDLDRDGARRRAAVLS